MYSKLLVVGSIARDTLMTFAGTFASALEGRDIQKLNISFSVETLEEHLGGTGLNIACNTRLLSPLSIHLFGGVGKDHTDIIELLKAKDIETRGVIIDQELYTATGKVITDQEQNQLWSFYHGALVRGKELDLKPFARDSLLILSATEEGAFLKAQRQAIALGIPYIYDPGMALSWLNNADLIQGVKNAYMLVGNESEMALIESKAKAEVQIITFGKDGVEYKSSGETHRLPAYEAKVKDPSGAGDAWRGGFIAGLIEGKSMKECLALGNALASFAVESKGAINHNPSKQEVEERAEKILKYKKT